MSHVTKKCNDCESVVECHKWDLCPECGSLNIFEVSDTERMGRQ